MAEPQQVAAPAAQPAQKKTRFIWGWSRAKLLNCLRCCNCCNGCCLAIFSVVVIVFAALDIILSLSLKVAGFVAASCLLLLGSLMCLMEMNFSFLRVKFARNCGWLFSYAGRTLFILFSGSMCMSIYNPEVTETKTGDDKTDSGAIDKLALALGSLTVANAVFNLVMLACHPQLRGQGAVQWLADPHAGKAKANNGAPKGDTITETAIEIAVAAAQSNAGHGGRSGSSGNEQETRSAEAAIAAYLRSNPDVAAKAMAGAGSLAVAGARAAMQVNSSSGNGSGANATPRPRAPSTQTITANPFLHAHAAAFVASASNGSPGATPSGSPGAATVASSNSTIPSVMNYDRGGGEPKPLVLQQLQERQYGYGGGAGVLPTTVTTGAGYSGPGAWAAQRRGGAGGAGNAPLPGATSSGFSGSSKPPPPPAEEENPFA